MTAGFRASPRHSRMTWLVRLLGVSLLVVLMARMNVGQVYQVLRASDSRLVTVAVLGVLPLMFIKTLRWHSILRSHSVDFHVMRAFRVYLGSLFVTSLTLAPVGELTRMLSVSSEGGVAPAKALSSVLTDRLFDLYLLLAVGGLGLLRATAAGAEAVNLVLLAILLTVPLALLLNSRAFGWAERLGAAAGGPVQSLSAPISWIMELRAGLRGLTWTRVLGAIAFTLAAYAVFFSQCYLLAVALGLRIGPAPVTYAVALGNLVSLLPVSISGLGTREATVIAYLAPLGVPGEAALSFSLLVFFTFHLAGGAMGAVAWWLRPLPLARTA